MNYYTTANITVPDEIAALAHHPNKIVADVFRVKRHPVMYTRTGYIFRLQLTMFLTHRDKTIDFTHPVSLIHGPNGTGKSSILQAIHFVLGGKAKDIRENCENLSNLRTFTSTTDAASSQQSSVIAYFYYSGTSEFPGPILVLKRTISNKLSNFFLCSRFPSSTKETLPFERISAETAHSILLSMGHFPNNEITMVSQSRMKVLVHMKPTERYNLFSTATLFNTIETNINNSQTLLKSSIKDCNTMLRYLKSLKDERKSRIKKIKSIQEYHAVSLDLLKVNLKRNSMELQKKRIHVHNSQLEITEIETVELAQLLDRQARQEEVKANRAPYLKRYDDEINELSNKLKEEKDALTEIFNNLTAQRDDWNNTMTKIDTLEAKLNAESSETTKLTKDLSQQQTILAKLAKDHDTVAIPEKNPEHLELEQEEASLQAKLATFEKQQESLTLRLAELDRKVEQRKAGEEMSRRKCKELEDELLYLQNDLMLKSSKGSVVDKCINSMTYKNQNTYSIVQDKKFHGEVIAPLAAYIWINESAAELQPIIQRVITSNILGTIAYKNPADEALIRDLLGQEAYLTHLVRPERPTMDDYNRLLSELSPEYQKMTIPLLSLLESVSPFALEILQLSTKVSRIVICENVEVARAVLDVGQRLHIQIKCLPKDRECIMMSGVKTSVSMIPAYNKSGSTKNQILYVATSDVASIQSEIHRKQQELNKASTKLEADYNPSKISILEAQEVLARNELQADIKEVTDSITNVMQKLEVVTSQISKFKEKYSLDIKEYNDKQETINRNRRNYENTLATIDSKTIKLKSIESNHAKNLIELSTLKSSLQDKKTSLSVAEDLYSKKEIAIKKLDDEIIHKVAQRDSIRAEDLDQQFINTRRAIETCTKKLEALKQLMNNAQEDICLEAKQFLDVFNNLEKMVPEYCAKRYEILTKLLLNMKEDTVLVDDKLKDLTTDQMKIECDKMHEKLCLADQSTPKFYHLSTRIAFLLIDFVSEYPLHHKVSNVVGQNINLNDIKIRNEKLLIKINEFSAKLLEQSENIDERRQKLLREFSGDIEAEEKQLLDLNSRIQLFTTKYKDIEGRILTLGTIFAQQIIRLIAIRARAEHDICFHFRNTSNITGINQFLHIQFPELPDIPPELLNIVDQRIINKYYEICGMQLRDSLMDNSQFDPSTRTQLLLDSQGQAASETLPATIVTAKGSIDIRSISRTASTLSGGESTFISLCFMISCWLIINTTYAQIDEWDVFMDAARRKKAFKLMMDVIMQTSIQVVLVTPNDIDISDLADNLKKTIGIIKLLSIRI